MSNDARIAGVVTTWDITQAVANGACEQSVEMIVTREVISAAPDCSILDMVTKLEQHQFSAMPVVDDGKVLGMVSSDLLAQRYLLRLLRSQAQIGL